VQFHMMTKRSGRQVGSALHLSITNWCIASTKDDPVLKV
jgi:hypothetical protein